MSDHFLWMLGLEFLAAFIADIAIHRWLKVSRHIAQWLVLALLLSCTVGFGYAGLSTHFNEKKTEVGATYVAYQYLRNSELNLLDSAVRNEAINADHKAVINLISRYKRGDYETVYINAQKLMRTIDLNTELGEAVLMMDTLSQTHLSKRDAQAYSDPEAEALSDQHIDEMIEKCFQSLDLSKRASKSYEALYELDKAVRSNQMNITKDRVQEIVETYSDSAPVLRAASAYYMQFGNVNEAMKCAEDLMKVDKSIESAIVYTDIVAQSSLTSSISSNPEDSEISKLEDEARNIRYKSYDQNNTEKETAKFQAQADELHQAVQALGTQRAINYLIARKPLFRDKTGLYDLQLAKLYLAVDEREKSKAYINQLIQNQEHMMASSPLKAPLMSVIDANNQADSDMGNTALAAAVDKLVEAQSQGVVGLSKATVNQRFSNYMASTLKYEKMSMFISDIDVSEYPEVKAYVNISEKKEGLFGFINDFAAENFALMDTQYEIADFEIINQDNKKKTDIVFVLDSSGSMSGQPLSELKIAATTCIENMDTWHNKIAVVEYNASSSIVVPSTNDKDQLITGIDSIRIGGGTNIPSGLKTGIDILKQSQSKRAIILMSDGQDGYPDQMGEMVQKAIQNNIVIFTVGLGDVNTAYLSDIATATGGQYVYASGAIELENVFARIQKYIANNYCFRYTVKDDIETDPRNLMITLKDYQLSSNKKYWVNPLDSENSEGENQNEDEDENDVIKVDEDTFVITGIQPRNLSIANVAEGTELTLSGVGFEEGMTISIGDCALTNIEVVSPSLAKGKLEAQMGSGQYRVRAILESGRTAIENEGLNVYRAGTTTKVKLGDQLITADTIGQVGTNQFIASGNVMINGFLHIDQELQIEAYNLPNDFAISPEGITDIGENGNLYGEGKLYISYSQASGGHVGRQTFANIVMNGKDYVVAEGAYALKIRGSDTDFNRTDHKFDFKIPFMADIEVADIELYPDKLHLNVAEVNPLMIIESVKSGLTSMAASSRSENGAAASAADTVSRNNAFKFQPKATKGSASIALTANDIIFGFEATLAVNDSIQFGKFGLNEVTLKLNSLDETHEYWKLGGQFNFANITRGLERLGGHIASYYWCPDEIGINAQLAGGIPIYNILFIDELGLKAKGLSGFFIDSEWVPSNVRDTLFAHAGNEAQRKDKELIGQMHAGVNLFKSLHISVPKNMREWADLGEVDNGEIALNFTNMSFKASADLKLLETKLADAAIQFGKDGIALNSKVSAEIAMFDIAMAGDLGLDFESTWSALELAIEANGNVDSGWLNYHVNGKSRIAFMAKYDGSYYCIELSNSEILHKCWYDDVGSPVLWRRFHVETISL
ncbi:VWA domain-containing protein [Fusibacter paucivorans]|uniref:VWA domain-containing protein n=1 Tax=Fusibacter paucivorans TaxID=76009 RepID=A0ABS5PT21_9FIRM|nr:VWA domain-containing protein [Fusibacter paucivorans]MBS7528310.1 VWA domain-containing protein [Fusibacter paucivorans]